MKLEFKITQRKENMKSKYVTAITDVKVKLSGNKDIVLEIYDNIKSEVINKNRILY